MQHSYDFSIVTAVRNGRSTIAQCLQSLDQQQEVSLQHVIVDACSTDGTSEVIKEFAKPNRTHLREPDKGLYDAWNKGTALCEGQYIGILSCDDFYAPDTLSRVVRVLKEQPNAIVYGDAARLEGADVANSVIDKGLLRPGRFFRGVGFWHPTLFCSKETFVRVGGFNLSYRIAADCDWIMRAYVRGIPFLHHDGLVYMRRGGISDAAWKAGREEYVRILASHPSLRWQARAARLWNTYLGLRRSMQHK